VRLEKRIGKLRLQLIAQHRHRRPRLIEAHARFHAAEGHEPVVVAFDAIDEVAHRHQIRLHAEGDEHMQTETDHRSTVLARCHADDRQQACPDLQRLAYDTRIAMVFALPQRVTDHRNRLPARCAVVLLVDQPAKCGSDTEYSKQIAGDELAPDPFGAIAASDRHRYRERTRHA